MTRGRIVGLAAVIAAIALLGVFSSWAIWRVTVAVVVAAAALRIGYAMISGLAQPVPEPPDEGELRQVKLTYRCSICGAEVRMTVAASDDPEPPRHCLEDMDLVAPIV